MKKYFENQSNLHEDVKLYFENLSAEQSVVTKDKGHGRIEKREYFLETEVFSMAVREHWGVENRLHWCLDVVFREDYCRTRKDNSAENFAIIRRIALNILKNYHGQMSLARKRRKCQYDTDFMADVLCSVVD